MLEPVEFVQYCIGNTRYKVPAGAPMPGIDYTIRKSRKVTFPGYTKTPFGRAEVQYLQWYYPKDKVLQGLGDGCELRWIKDEATGKNRYLKFLWCRKYKTKSQKASVKTHIVEVPHWDFDPTAKEEIET